MQMRWVAAAAVLGLLAVGSMSSAAPQAQRRTLWQIGTADGSYRELAIAGRYPLYASRFPRDVVYQVGRSRAASGWPFIHPGPSDPWAGSRLHPFRIDFSPGRVPSTACLLTVHLVDSRHDSQQVLSVDVNGRRRYRFAVVPGVSELPLTDPGAGRQSAIVLPFPSSLLRVGRNSITLTVDSGSWVLYDAVALETGTGVPAAPVLTGIRAALLPDARVRLRVVNAGAEGEARVAVVGGAPPRRVWLEPGPNTLSLDLRDRAAPPAVSVAVEVGGKRQVVVARPPAVAWRIGADDGGYGEFAIAGNYPAYAASFPADVTYRVGRSDPKRDWPFIHPGPHDAWAGARQHPFRIDFTLPAAPTEAARLDLALVDTQPLGGPELQVDVNGRASYRLPLPAGGSDSSLTDPRQGRAYRTAVPIAPSLLRAGDNRITLTIVRGSWMTYDAVSLELGADLPSTPVVAGVGASTTPLFRRVRGKLYQVVRVSLRNTSVQGSAVVRIAGATPARRIATLVPGENTLDVLAPPVARAALAAATVRTGSGDTTARFVAAPERRWRVYVAPSTHTDIGYTDFQERVFQRHNENSLAALTACDQSPTFRWNLEVGYQAELLRQADPAAYAHLMGRVRQGRIGLGGLYLNMLTGLCSGEELVRAVTFVQDLARVAQAEAVEANLTDVPTAVGTLPMLLSQAGVRYFADGANDVIPFQGGGREIDHSPYWWQGLDGSRVLAITTHAYAQAGAIGLLDDVGTVEQRLPGWLRQIGRDGYPGDAAYVYGAFSDNQPMSARYDRVAAEWNARWEYPKLIVATADEFFRDVEAHVGPKLPVVRGDLGVAWEDGAASSALETAMVRHARARLDAAERWHALAAALGAEAPFPSAAVRQAWEETLLFDEHTWGAAGSVTEPDSEQTRHQWAVKARFAQDASRHADDLLAGGLQAFARAAARGGPAPEPGGEQVTVFNEYSWPRDIVAHAPVPAGVVWPRVTGADGARSAVPCQREGGAVAFVARDVPPLGWRTFRVTAGAAGAPAGLLRRGLDDWSWETPELRLRIDPRTGALSSLVVKGSGAEWVSAANGLGLNQLLYAIGGGGAKTFDPNAQVPPLDVATHTAASVTVVQDGPVRAVLRIRRSGPRAPTTDTYLVLGPDRKVELVNVVHKRETLVKEAAYFAFPFSLDAVAAKRAFVELPYGVMQVERDQAPGGCRDWYATNSFAAVSDGRRTAYLASPHAPMLTVNDIFRGRQRTRLGPLNGCLFAYVLNNIWGTNYKASQGGDLVFSFVLNLDDAPFDPVRATRFGWEALADMTDPAAGVRPDVWGRGTRQAVPTVPGTTAAGSMVWLAPATAVVGGLTWRDGRLVVRLYNPAEWATAESLSIAGTSIEAAWVADLTGAPRSRIPLERPGGPVRVRVPGRGLATLALRLARPGR